jgi:hypothetical protein
MTIERRDGLSRPEEEPRKLHFCKVKISLEDGLNVRE